MKSVSTHQCIVLGLLLAIVSGCATRAPRDKALIQTGRGSKIVLLNGKKVSTRRAIVSPRDHTVRFETQTKLLLFSPQCEVELRLKPGASYTLSTELEETRLPADALGALWRKLETTGVLSILDPPKEATRLVLPCTDCITFRSSYAEEEAVSCHRYRANARIEELCRMRDETDVAQCVRDGRTLVLAWRYGPTDWMMFVPGLDAEYSRDEHLDAFNACIKGDSSDVEACLAARGWEAVP